MSMFSGSPGQFPPGNRPGSGPDLLYTNWNAQLIEISNRLDAIIQQANNDRSYVQGHVSDVFANVHEGSALQIALNQLKTDVNQYKAVVDGINFDETKDAVTELKQYVFEEDSTPVRDVISRLRSDIMALLVELQAQTDLVQAKATVNEDNIAVINGDIPQLLDKIDANTENIASLTKTASRLNDSKAEQTDLVEQVQRLDELLEKFNFEYGLEFKNWKTIYTTAATVDGEGGYVWLLCKLSKYIFTDGANVPNDDFEANKHAQCFIKYIGAKPFDATISAVVTGKYGGEITGNISLMLSRLNAEDELKFGLYRVWRMTNDGTVRTNGFDVFIGLHNDRLNVNDPTATVKFLATGVNVSFETYQGYYDITGVEKLCDVCVPFNEYNVFANSGTLALSRLTTQNERIEVTLPDGRRRALAYTTDCADDGGGTTILGAVIRWPYPDNVPYGYLKCDGHFEACQDYVDYVLEFGLAVPDVEGRLSGVFQLPTEDGSIIRVLP